MVAHQLYVIRSSSQLKGFYKLSLNLLQRGEMSCARVIFQGFSTRNLCNSERLKNFEPVYMYLLIKIDCYNFSRTDHLYANRTTQSLLSATVHVTEKHLRLEILGAVSFFLLDSLICLMLKLAPFLFTCFFQLSGSAGSTIQLPFSFYFSCSFFIS